MKSRYDLMKASNVQDEKGNSYPDPLTLNLKYVFDNPLKTMQITQRHCLKPYLISYDAYDMCCYDDLILWFNGISYPSELIPGEELLIPNLVDLRKFYSDNLVTR